MEYLQLVSRAFIATFRAEGGGEREKTHTLGEKEGRGEGEIL